MDEAKKQSTQNKAWPSLLKADIISLRLKLKNNNLASRHNLKLQALSVRPSTTLIIVFGKSKIKIS